MSATETELFVPPTTRSAFDDSCDIGEGGFAYPRAPLFYLPKITRWQVMERKKTTTRVTYRSPSDRKERKKTSRTETETKSHDITIAAA